MMYGANWRNIYNNRKLYDILNIKRGENFLASCCLLLLHWHRLCESAVSRFYSIHQIVKTFELIRSFDFYLFQELIFRNFLFSQQFVETDFFHFHDRNPLLLHLSIETNRRRSISLSLISLYFFANFWMSFWIFKGLEGHVLFIYLKFESFFTISSLWFSRWLMTSRKNRASLSIFAPEW